MAFKSRAIICVHHVASAWEIRNANLILVGKKGKRNLEDLVYVEAQYYMGNRGEGENCVGLSHM
jgi:hypothetical protein